MAWPDNAPVFTICAAQVTVVGATTLALIHTTASGDGSRIALCRAWVSQSGTPTNYQETVEIDHYASGTMPTVVAHTPKPLIMDLPAAGIVGGTSGAAGTAGINASAEGTGTRTVLWAEGFNTLNGWLWLPTQDQYIGVPPDTTVGLKFTSTPTALTEWTVGLVYIEIN